jgi:aryl-alcohol dehydrogenase-like predicted oxidoreductase
MDYKNPGKTGLKVSSLCLETMQFGWSADDPLSHKILSAAYESGVNFIDTADKLEQLTDNLSALSVILTTEEKKSLDGLTARQEEA